MNHKALVPGMLLCLACSSGTSDDLNSGISAGFTVQGISVPPHSQHPLNRPIEVQFTEDVDPSSVSHQTFRIRALAPKGLNGSGADTGWSATGTFSFPAPDVVRFTPTCPDAQSEPGLAPATQYRVRLPGSSNAGPSIRSASGTPLEESFQSTFATPARASDELYEDTIAGPPSLVFRDQGSGVLAATHLRLGQDVNQRVYFEADSGGQVNLPAGFEAEPNLYSRIGSRVSWIVQFDQPIDPGPFNLGPARIRLEGLRPDGSWLPMATSISLEDNCGEAGARLKVSPMGILPQDSEVRLYLGQGLSDLSGEGLPSSVGLALVPIGRFFDPGTSQPGDHADHAFEAFVGGSEADGSLEDTSYRPAVPRATWGDGQLRAATGFTGTGGPKGTFDWHIPPGTDFILDTVLTTIVGGPDGTPTDSQQVINGVLDIRDLLLPSNSRIIAVGPNPVTILATGDLDIAGEIILKGSHSPGVVTLNTTDLPEPGAAGQAGGGNGGTGSPLTDRSTPRGGAGFGPSQAPGGGGQGGETGYSAEGKVDRRGAGGGGGRLGRDVRYDPLLPGTGLVRCQILTGMDAERGAAGGPGGLGAESGIVRAIGGGVGPVPFADGDPENDFFGVMRLPDGTLVQGELSAPLAGTGGGAGGDAVGSDSFPLEPFSTTGDEKGAGGGGGGGLIRVLAAGEILIQDGGRIVADGGNGGGGENTNFFDRVGGGSGGGSGGSIILESLTRITVHGAVGGDGYRDDTGQPFHSGRALSALGGQGGAGNLDSGGAGQNGTTAWWCDRIPFDHFEGPSFDQIPPYNITCFQAQPDFGDAYGGPTVGAGGDGGPGMIQLHVPDAATDLIFPDAGGDLTRVAAPTPIGYDYTSGQFAGSLAPSFGSRSSARSRWIPLGLARQDTSGADQQVLLFFGGTDASGLVQTSGDEVVLEPPLVGPDPLGAAPNTPYVDPGDPFTLVVDASGVTGFDDLYKRNPTLLRGASVALADSSDPSMKADYFIVEASYDPALDRIFATVTSAGPSLLDFVASGNVLAAIVPRSFRLTTGSAPDSVEDSEVRILFDAARADTLGRPDESTRYSSSQGALTGDPSQLNMDEWDFVRFQVEFITGATGKFDALAEPTALNHLRVPFRF